MSSAAAAHFPSSADRVGFAARLSLHSFVFARKIEGNLVSDETDGLLVHELELPCEAHAFSFQMLALPSQECGSLVEFFNSQVRLLEVYLQLV